MIDIGIMLKPPEEPYMVRSGSGSSLASDPKFIDNSRRRNSNWLLASPNLNRRGSTLAPSMNPSGGRRGSIMDMARVLGTKITSRKM